MLGTITFLVAHAAEVVPIIRDELLRPEDAAGVHIERQDGVAGLGRRVCEVDSGTDKDSSVREVERWRRPHRYAGRSPAFGTGGSTAGQLRGLGDGVSFPDMTAGFGIQRDDATAEFA